MIFSNKEGMDLELERLINAYGNEVLRISFMYLKNRDLAEDAFQEVFIKVYKKYSSFRNESSEKTWIVKITINVCKDILKSKWNKDVYLYDSEDINLISDNISDTDAIIENNELYQQVLKLDEKYKSVIILYYYQGFSIKEIAEILKTTTGNVSSMLSRARNILKGNLKDFR